MIVAIALIKNSTNRATKTNGSQHATHSQSDEFSASMFVRHS